MSIPWLQVAASSWPACSKAADEMRRIQRLAYRMRQLQETHPGFGSESKSAWERNPHWQPLREVIEKLLVTYDWGEAFVALNLVLKLSFDQVFMLDYGGRAHARDEEVLHKILRSLYEDWNNGRSQSAPSAESNRRIKSFETETSRLCRL